MSTMLSFDLPSKATVEHHDGEFEVRHAGLRLRVIPFSTPEHGYAFHLTSRELSASGGVASYEMLAQLWRGWLRDYVDWDSPHEHTLVLGEDHTPPAYCTVCDQLTTPGILRRVWGMRRSHGGVLPDEVCQGVAVEYYMCHECFPVPKELL